MYAPHTLQSCLCIDWITILCLPTFSIFEQYQMMCIVHVVGSMIV
jgi:hypothetical protein